jgi:hypothetical protein
VDLPGNLVSDPLRSVDKAVLVRLRDAIASEDGDEEQLQGVLRMLGAETPEKHQLPLFGKIPAEEPPREFGTP